MQTHATCAYSHRNIDKHIFSHSTAHSHISIRHQVYIVKIRTYHWFSYWLIFPTNNCRSVNIPWKYAITKDGEGLAIVCSPLSPSPLPLAPFLSVFLLRFVCHTFCTQLPTVIVPKHCNSSSYQEDKKIVQFYITLPTCTRTCTHTHARYMHTHTHTHTPKQGESQLPSTFSVAIAVLQSICGLWNFAELSSEA